MRRRLLKLGLIGAMGVFLLGAGAYGGRHALFRSALDLPEFTHDLGETRSLMVPMRDGVQLSTTVHLPEGAGPWPTIVMRNPYAMSFVFPFLAEVGARYGFAAVHQTVRGSGDSGGEWVPLVHEQNDGLDTLSWLKAQPWQNERWALLGMSYLAATQWTMADRLPPQVKTMVPMVYATTARANAYENGLFKHDVMTAWASFMPDGDMHFGNDDVYQKMIRERPPLEADRHLPKRLDWYRDWLSDDFWSTEGPRTLQAMPERVTVPVLMIGGWHDVFLGGMFEDFERLATRDQSKMIIGPWNHLLRSDEDYPGDIGGGGQISVVKQWLDHHLRGEPLKGPVGVVQTYAVREGYWHSRTRFPPETSTVTLHLAAIEKSKGCSGGRLQATPEAGEISFRYDPTDPVPSRGGSKMLAFAFRTYDAPRPGIVDQSGLCEREDVLTFLSEPLEAPLHLAGRVRVDLDVSSTAEETAFTAKLIEVSSDGAVNVRDGITLLGQGKTIHLWPIEWRFKKGVRLRLDVSSSNFPVFHAHPNLPGPWASIAETQVATQTLRGGRISLPIVDRLR